MEKTTIKFIGLIGLIGLIGPSIVFAATNIDSTYRYAWNDVIGWIDFYQPEMSMLLPPSLAVTPLPRLAILHWTALPRLMATSALPAILEFPITAAAILAAGLGTTPLAGLVLTAPPPLLVILIR